MGVVDHGNTVPVDTVCKFGCVTIKYCAAVGALLACCQVPSPRKYEFCVPAGGAGMYPTTPFVDDVAPMNGPIVLLLLTCSIDSHTPVCVAVEIMSPPAPSPSLDVTPVHTTVSSDGVVGTATYASVVLLLVQLPFPGMAEPLLL